MREGGRRGDIMAEEINSDVSYFPRRDLKSQHIEFRRNGMRSGVSSPH